MRRTKDDVFIAMAFVQSLRGTCARRKVGVVFVNARGRLLTANYNGPASGDAHCTTTECPGAKMPSGMGLELCEAIHAEQNALAQCQDVWEIDTVYCTDSPCKHCIKMLKNTGARRIVYLRKYPSQEDVAAYWCRENAHRIHIGVPARVIEQYELGLSWLKEFL